MASELDDEQSEEFKLLVAYCSKRSRQRSQQNQIYKQGVAHFQGPVQSFWPFSVEDAGSSRRKNCEGGSGVRWPLELLGTLIHSSQIEEQDDGAQSGVADRLLQIADSALIPKAEAAGVGDQDDIVEKLVELMKTSGDVMDKQIRHNDVLQQQLQTALTYAMFERLTSKLQNLVSLEQTSRAAAVAASEERMERKKIALAFEVTSRLSTVDFIPKRRVLVFGERYIHQHHSAWVQQHGGWEEVFDTDDID